MQLLWCMTSVARLDDRLLEIVSNMFRETRRSNTSSLLRMQLDTDLV